jgi:cobalamin-dependent methionine synthase I
VFTSLGVSNISFGLSPHSRHVLNSVFLHYAIEYGLDMAIVHASKILPLYKISDEEREICRKLIFDERTSSYDPLKDLLAHFSGKKGEVKKQASTGGPIEERLKNRIIDGNKVNMQSDLDEGLKKYSALEIINTILLEGMKVVGELFGSGQMQLPFVLQSAEAMKSAVGYLEQFMDKSESSNKGTMVIATVKGDVHDIGKNLVDIILTNNGYKVINLGIQCPLERMLTAFDEHNADAIGMSGLLVKSTLIMKENLQVMNERELHIPVILGGAALTRRYVEQDLRAIYNGNLFYANDAFDGLHFMQEIAQGAKSPLPASGKRLNIDGLLAEMEKAHKETFAVLEKISDENFIEKNAVKDWSIHNIVSHLVAWEGMCSLRIQAYLDGNKDQIHWYANDAVNDLNAKFVKERSTKKRSEVMNEWRVNRKSITEQIQRLQESDLGFNVGGGTLYDIIVENTFNHERHHLKSINSWLKARGGEEEVALSGLEAKIALAPKESPTAVRQSIAVTTIPSPPFWGSKVIEDVPLDEIFPYINEIALLRGQWQVRKGKLSDADYQNMVKEKILPDLERLKREAKQQRLLQPKIAYGYFPCQSEGNDLIIYKPSGAKDAVESWGSTFKPEKSALTEWVRFSFPRQTKGKYVCISDFFSSTTSGKIDVVSFHLVTMGKVASDYANTLFQSNNYKEYLYFHGLSVETAEALAEFWHKKIREELGIQTHDAVEIKKLFSQHYQGSRYSFGYPACPSLEDQAKLFQLIRPERIEVELTEEFQLVPEQSTSAIIVHHPEAKYFNI